MLRCNKCKISIRGDLQQCPLCQGDLAGATEPGDAIFPPVPPPRHRLLLQLLLFASFVAVAVCVAINLSLPESGVWSAFVAAGLASLWVSLAIAIKKRENLPKNILWQVATISVLALLWDFFTGWRGWSIDYVLPMVFACAMAAMAVVGRIQRLRIEDFMIYLIMDCILGVLPLYFLLRGKLGTVYPSAACIAGSMISLSALIVFNGPALKREIERRMHL